MAWCGRCFGEGTLDCHRCNGSGLIKSGQECNLCGKHSDAGQSIGKLWCPSCRGTGTEKSYVPSATTDSFEVDIAASTEHLLLSWEANQAELFDFSTMNLSGHMLQTQHGLQRICSMGQTEIPKRLASQFYEACAKHSKNNLCLELFCISCGIGTKKNMSMVRSLIEDGNSASPENDFFLAQACLSLIDHGLEEGNFKEHLARLKSASDQGNPDALRLLGKAYINGWYGLNADRRSGVSLIVSAADAGDMFACQAAGLYFEKGDCVRTDHQRAFKYRLRSANGGRTWPMTRVAVDYREGQLVSENPTLAATWAFRAADRGNTTGEFMFGSMSDEGFGLPAASRSRALYWLRKSAAQNNEGAIKALRRRGY